MARFSSVFLITVLAIATSHNAAAQSMPETGPADAKRITDPAEYQAYIEALKTHNPYTIDKFVSRYPQSSALEEVLEHAIAPYLESSDYLLSYWASGEEKVLEFAERLREIAPGDIRALAVITTLDSKRVAIGRHDMIQKMCADSQSGLKQLGGWHAPNGMPRSESRELRDSVAYTFNLAAGECAYLDKDLSAARNSLARAFQLYPTRVSAAYLLTLSDLQEPIDPEGFAYCDKTIQLLRLQGVQGRRKGNVVAKYCRAVSQRVHHREGDGRNQSAGQTAVKDTPPLSLVLDSNAAKPH